MHLEAINVTSEFHRTNVIPSFLLVSNHLFSGINLYGVDFIIRHILIHVLILLPHLS